MKTHYRSGMGGSWGNSASCVTARTIASALLGAVALLALTGANALAVCPGGSPDADGDGMMDTCDPCVNTGPQTMVSLHRAYFFQINSATNDDRFKAIGTITPLNVSSINLLASGARVLLQRAGETPTDTGLFDQSLPNAPYPSPNALACPACYGWTYTGTWLWRDLTAVVSNIRRLRISQMGSGARILMDGRGANVFTPITAPDLPIRLTTVFGGQTQSTAGQCAETGFVGGDCVFNGTSTLLSCAH